MGYLLAQLVTTLLLAGACAALVLAAGLPIWLSLTRRPPTLAELLGPCFLLGLLPLTGLAAVLIPFGALQGPAPVLASVGVLGLGLVVAGRAIPRGDFFQRYWLALLAGLRRHPLASYALALLVLLELLVASVPTTAWDACTYHYGLVENFRRFRTLAPQGLSIYEYWHLNGELLNALWMGLAGERAANAFYVVQVLSLGAAVYWGVRRYASASWACMGALLVLGLPVVVHQSAGGWVDTLLVQSVLLAVLAYQAGLAERNGRGWAVMAGLFAGYAWGVKQSAPVLLAPLACLGLWDLVRSRELRSYVLFVPGAALLVAAPWLARTWLTTGNPLFPALPRFTRLITPPDLSYASSHAGNPLSGVYQMLRAHTLDAGLLNEAIPLWLLLILASGAAVFLLQRQRGLEMRRMWTASLICFAAAYLFFSAAPRYALFAYVLGLIPALAALSGFSEQFRAVRYGVVGATVLSTALGLVVAGGKTWNRRDVLTGRVTPEAYIAAVYPHVQLLSAVRNRADSGGSVLVFNSLSYRNGLPTFDAEPRWPGSRLANWAHSTPEEVLENCRRNGIRWILLPFGYRQFRSGVAAWAAMELGPQRAAEPHIRDHVVGRFPEWIWSGHPPEAALPADPRFAAVVGQWAAIRSRLTPVASLPDVTLYELKPDTTATAARQ
jgi:dolichyl-phosphate-mannose-protein mannosyltransferase